MAQITLTLELTPGNTAVLCEMLPRLETRIPYTTEMATAVGDAKVGEQLSFFGNDTDKPAPSTEKKSASATSKKKPEDAPPAEEKSGGDTPKAPSKTDVRAVALKLSKAGQQDKLKEIFAKYGADKLSGVAESDYPALMKDLEEAANE